MKVVDLHVETRIGEAIVIKNEVVNAATTGQINVGDGVLRDETVQTGADSAARARARAVLRSGAVTRTR